MASPPSYRKHHPTTSQKEYATGSFQPHSRQPLGSARLVPTPIRGPPYPKGMSPLLRNDLDLGGDRMTPFTLHPSYGKSSFSTSPTSTTMTSTTHPTPSPQTPSAVESSGASSFSVNLAGIQSPAPFVGPYPIGYLRKESVPSEENDMGDLDVSELRRSSRQGAASCNPWDYVCLDQETAKEGEEVKGKARRRFAKRELEALEVLWSISKSPTKYQRQRLGAWLGVKTKHITVWFQNRRQEEKRHSREGGSQPQNSSRSNRGTYDPVTGKWRPVPLSCISSLQPPPAEKLAAIQAISLGQITREMYFEQYPLEDSPPPLPSNTIPLRQLTRTTSSSLDEVLQAREVGFGEVKKMFRRPGDVELRGEGEERNRDILALMPSDPPSIDLNDLEDDAVMIEKRGSEDEEDEAPAYKQKVKASRGLGRPSTFARTASADYLGRATSLDVLASSSRAKQLIGPGPPRSVSGPAGPLDPQRRSEKRSLPPVPAHDESAKRSKSNRHSSQAFRPSPPEPRCSQRYPFPRSQSATMVAPPPTPQIRSPGLTRSYSFSSTSSIFTSTAESSFHRNLEVHPGKTVYSCATTLDLPRKQGQQETDEEVVDAANKLLQMLGGS